MSLSLVLNGQLRTFDSLTAQATLADLVAELQLKGDRIAVEHNGMIVQRTEWPATALAAQDRLEVVHFVGGGAPAREVLPGTTGSAHGLAWS